MNDWLVRLAAWFSPPVTASRLSCMVWQMSVIAETNRNEPNQLESPSQLARHQPEALMYIVGEASGAQ